MIAAAFVLGSSPVLADESEALRQRYQARLDAAVDRGLAFLASRQISTMDAERMGQA